MNRKIVCGVSNRSRSQHPLGVACAAGLLTLGLASGVWAGSVPAGVTGGQPGATGNAIAGAAGNGGQGGGFPPAKGTVGSAGAAGSGGAGGASATTNTSFSPGGPGGSVGVSATSNSIITGTMGTGGSGNGGGNNRYTAGGGGGGGGDGVFATAAGITITNQSGSAIKGGTGGAGGNGGNGPAFPSAYYYGGSGGGGGNGVEFAGSGTLVNNGTINGGSGGSGGASYIANTSGPGGSGGGHGVLGANITITNSGTIAGGAAGGFGAGPHGTAGTAGDAILFTGGGNKLNLLTGSTITGDIELATGAHANVYPSVPTLASNIVLDSTTSYLILAPSSTPLTVSGVISGSGYLYVSPSTTTGSVILTGTSASTFRTALTGGLLQVDGSIGNVNVYDGTLAGTGKVGAITLDSSSVLHSPAISPGDTVGTLSGTSLTWNGGGAFNFQLGSTNATTNTDLLALTGALTKGGAGTFMFHFSDGTGAPQAGVTYTLITFGSNSGFSVGDFSYDYSGADPTLVGSFNLTASALTFTVATMPVTLQSFEVD